MQHTRNMHHNHMTNIQPAPDGMAAACNIPTTNMLCSSLTAYPKCNSYSRRPRLSCKQVEALRSHFGRQADRVGRSV
jgi:hypothetical protein